MESVYRVLIFGKVQEESGLSIYPSLPFIPSTNQKEIQPMSWWRRNSHLMWHRQIQFPSPISPIIHTLAFYLNKRAQIAWVLLF